MTTLSINTPNTSVNAVLSMPINSALDKQTNLSKKLFTYSLAPKNSYRKPTSRFTTTDWDVNMNELEFE